MTEEIQGPCSALGQVRPEARCLDHSRTASASGRLHDKVITRRRVTGKDPRLPVERDTPSHSHFVPKSTEHRSTEAQKHRSRRPSNTPPLPPADGSQSGGTAP